MKKILCIVLSILLLGFTFLTSEQGFIFANIEDEIYSYLMIGLDDAAGNTDVLAIVSYNALDNAISVIQLPRDTYFSSGFYQNKLNQVYPGLLQGGNNDEEAFRTLTDTVSALLGVELKGYLVFDSKSFVNLIDSIGGVTINVSEDFQYLDELNKAGIEISAGENLLDGKKAFQFVRHRASYLNGDLARMDAQKIFFSGLFDTLREYIVEKGAYSLVNAVKGNFKSDFSIVDIILMVIKHSSKFKEVSFMYLTFPGEAYKSQNGVWYYQINKKSASEAINRYLKATGLGFDSKEQLLDKNSDKSREIYYSSNISYNVYTHENIDDIKVK